ncbi:hypothetical protein [Amycolatopsis thermoflava]|uniref:hypothetical protein n=1 Tax=Amycolatopsis thermoflava TaxID=84480 RepID=UPI000F4C5D69|nr:hypothetical protein [Amycolatopsis thermoflava]
MCTGFLGEGQSRVESDLIKVDPGGDGRVTTHAHPADAISHPRVGEVAGHVVDAEAADIERGTSNHGTQRGRGR